VSGFFVGALGGALAGNMFTTKAVVEMFKCVASGNDDEGGGCATNPFYTPFPYLFIAVSLTLACVSLYMLAVGLRTFEALYMITVFEGFMIVSGSISGNLVMDEKAGQPTAILCLYAVAIGVILCGLYVLCKGEAASMGDRLLTRTMQPAADAQSLAELRGDGEHGMGQRDGEHVDGVVLSAMHDGSPECSPNGTKRTQLSDAST